MLFNKSASINTAGLVATTKNISDADFNAGNYNFTGESTASVINMGTINITDGGYASLLANSVRNDGTITAIRGKVTLTGASEATINLNGNSLVNLRVDKGVLDALVENKGAIYADGGEIYLTTNAVNELLKGVVNNTGIIEANSIDGITGKVELFAHGGTVKIGGTITAKDGFVETSGKSLHVEDSTIIKTKEWLIDPDNVIIESSGGDVLTGESVSVTAIQNALSTANIELQATTNITVNENIIWSTDKQLTLSADSINVNKTIENTNTTNGGVYFNAANVRNKVVFGVDGKVIIHNVNQLQWMNQALGGKYELGSNIDASVTSSWNGSKGWIPIFTSEVIYDSEMYEYITNYFGFTGTFNGLGHTISNLTINDTTRYHTGLFGIIDTATVQNVGLVGVNITGYNYVGALVGVNNSSTSIIKNAYTTGLVNGYEWVGGLVGANVNNSTIKNSYATVTVSGTRKVGGLAGYSSSAIINSYASGTVSGTTYVGGLVGLDFIGGTITNAYYDNQANTGTMGDSGYGKTKAQLLALVTDAIWENTIWGTAASQTSGYTTDAITLPFLRSATKFDNTLFNSGFGTALNPYTITNWTQLQNINNSNILTHNYYFNLSNDMGSTTAGYTNSGTGWNPIGDETNKFKGTFDGLNHTISNLYINDSAKDCVGLFGNVDEGTIKNIGVLSVDITGKVYVGGLVGANEGTITNAYATGSVSGNSHIGGLVGSTSGTITNAYATTSVSGTDNLGGLAGSSIGFITNTYATGLITGTTKLGGLVGWSKGTTLTNSFWDMQTTGQPTVGVGNGSSGVAGKTTAELQKFSTFNDAGWDIASDSALAVGTPLLSMNGATPIWKIKTDVAPTQTPVPTPVPTPTPEPIPEPITPPTPQKHNNTGDILTPIINGIQTTVQVPNILVNLLATNAPSVTPSLAMQQANTNLATNFGVQTGSVQITSIAAKGEEANALVTLSEIKEAMGDSTQDVRVPFAYNSIIDLVNGGVHLPEGVDQQFYVTKTPKKKSN